MEICIYLILLVIYITLSILKKRIYNASRYRAYISSFNNCVIPIKRTENKCKYLNMVGASRGFNLECRVKENGSYRWKHSGIFILSKISTSQNSTSQRIKILFETVPRLRFIRILKYSLFFSFGLRAIKTLSKRVYYEHQHHLIIKVSAKAVIFLF